VLGAEVAEFIESIDNDNNDNDILSHTDSAAATDGKRRYVVDYFVIADFAIYDRCATLRL